MVNRQRRMAIAMESDGKEAVEPSALASAGDLPAEAQGHVIVNPISGERIVIRVSGAQTGGELMVFDLYLPPGAHVPAGHVHPVQVEQFTVLAGQMRFRIGRFGFGRRTILAHPGETVRVPPGTAHWFGNPGAQMSHARVEVRPALRMEEMFEMTGEMSVTGHLGGTTLPRLTDLARIMLTFQREVAVPNVPPFLVRLTLAPLAWLGRRRTRDKIATRA